MNETTKEGQLNPHKNMRVVTTTLIVTFIVMSGFGIRLINLGEPGFGTDEPLHVYAAKSILEIEKPELPSGFLYGRAILFTKLVAYSFKVFGMSEFSARLPSAVFGTFTILLIFFMGKQLFGTRVGVISALLIAFIPYQIAWSRECRMYTMFQFFFLAGVFSFYKGFENSIGSKPKKAASLPNKHSHLAGYFYNWRIDWKWIAVSVILLYISFSLQRLTAIFGLSLLSYFVLMGIIVVVNESWQDFLSSKYLFFISLTLVAGFFALLFVPSILQLAKSHLFFKPYWASKIGFNPLYYITFLTSAPLFPIGAFFVLGSIQIITRKNKAGFYTLVCVVAPMVILSFIPSMVRGDRYIFNILPLIILIASYSINVLLNSESRLMSELLSENRILRYKPLISCIILVLCLLFISTPWIHYGYRTLFDYYGPEKNLAMAHRNWREACDYIKKSSKPGDVTIPSEPLTARYYGCINIQYYIANDCTTQPQFLVKDEKRISDVETLKKVLSKHSRGWLLVDSGRFYSSFRTPTDLREFIFNNLTYHDVGKDRTVLIFSWDERRVSFD